MSAGRYEVAFLAGHGIGPELTGEASRALAEVAELHGFELAEAHVPIGAEAVARVGEPLPASTRDAVLAADAVLASSRREPALRLLEADLDLRAAATFVRFGRRGDVAVLYPLGAGSMEWTVARSFALAARRGGRVALAGEAPEVHARAASEAHPGVAVERLAPAAALRSLALAPERFDVVLADAVYGPALAEVAAGSPREGRVVATAGLAEHGPGVFAAAHGHAAAIAGQGVANPSSVLLAASVMLAEGLGERAAAETLAGALVEALDGRVRTPDLVESGLGATTREFMDSVLGLFQVSSSTAEFMREAWA